MDVPAAPTPAPTPTAASTPTSAIAGAVLARDVAAAIADKRVDGESAAAVARAVVHLAHDRGHLPDAAEAAARELAKSDRVSPTAAGVLTVLADEGVVREVVALLATLVAKEAPGLLGRLAARLGGCCPSPRDGRSSPRDGGPSPRGGGPSPRDGRSSPIGGRSPRDAAT